MRSNRWHPHVLVVALVALVALLVVTRADGGTVPVLAKASGDAAERQQAAYRHLLRDTIQHWRQQTWSCQDELGARHTRAERSIWALGPSNRYLSGWVVPHWKQQANVCQGLLERRTIPSTYDWLTAVDFVQRIYPGTRGWLLFISRREGGWGRFVMNHQGSGAGGWMQFMASTFYAYNDRAYADARRRGFIIDPATNRWTHPLGQAVTAGYMRYVGLDGCHWCL